MLDAGENTDSAFHGLAIPILRLGTRASLLALTQSGQVKRMLEAKHPGLRVRLVKIRTSGDEFQSVEFFKKSNTGVFTKEIEQKLLSGEIDLAVHSLKDLTTELPKGLILGAVPKRLDVRDVLITKKRLSLNQLPPGSLVGTGSPRRKRQVLLARPDLRCVDVRGNLDTRIGRVIKEGKQDAVILARAGLMRLKKYQKYARVIPDSQLLPAVGQAALGIEVRANDARTLSIVRKINHARSFQEVAAERRFLQTLQGGCRVPVGIRTRIRGSKISLSAAVFSMHDQRVLKANLTASAAEPEKAGERLAKRLLRMGAASLIQEARA